jgi:hypothetical protein
VERVREEGAHREDVAFLSVAIVVVDRALTLTDMLDVLARQPVGRVYRHLLAPQLTRLLASLEAGLRAFELASRDRGRAGATMAAHAAAPWPGYRASIEVVHAQQLALRATDALSNVDLAEEANTDGSLQALVSAMGMAGTLCLATDGGGDVSRDVPRPRSPPGAAPHSPGRRGHLGLLGGQQLRLGQLLLRHQALVLVVLPGIAHPEAPAEVGIGVREHELIVPGACDDLAHRHGLEVFELLRGIGRPHGEAGGRQQVLGGRGVLLGDGGAASGPQAQGRQKQYRDRPWPCPHVRSPL